jgi:hypothetical protein
MQKNLALILILIYFITNTEFVQLFKLPILISHYYQHHKQNHSISFTDFLAMHYGGDDGTSADDDTDRQLPFQNPVLSYQMVVYFPLVQNPVVLIPPDKIIILHNSYIQQPGSSGYCSLILRPPLLG